MDGAGWHVSKEITQNLPLGLHLEFLPPYLPLGLHLEFLPPYSPELYAKRYPLGQPAERLWPIVDEPLVNRSFTNLEQLEEIVYTRCQVILQQPELVKGITNFSWWPQFSLATAV